VATARSILACPVCSEIVAKPRICSNCFKIVHCDQCKFIPASLTIKKVKSCPDEDTDNREHAGITVARCPYCHADVDQKVPVELAWMQPLVAQLSNE